MNALNLVCTLLQAAFRAEGLMPIVNHCHFCTQFSRGLHLQENNQATKGLGYS